MDGHFYFAQDRICYVGSGACQIKWADPGDVGSFSPLPLSVYRPVPSHYPFGIKPDSTSYPFLALARRCGVEYGAVLAVAEILTKPHEAAVIPWKVALWHSLTPRVRAEIDNLCMGLK